MQNMSKIMQYVKAHQIGTAVHCFSFFPSSLLFFPSVFHSPVHPPFPVFLSLSFHLKILPKILFTFPGNSAKDWDDYDKLVRKDRSDFWNTYNVIKIAGIAVSVP
jgi:hypothetical protein